MASRQLNTTIARLRRPGDQCGFVKHRPYRLDLAQLKLQAIPIAPVSVMDKPRRARRMLNASPTLARRLIDKSANGDFANSVS